MRWSPPREALPASGRRNDWETLRALLPYLWTYRGRVVFALTCLVAAKLATVSVPILLKQLVDHLAPAQAAAAGALVVPVALVVAYGLLRLSTSLFTELAPVPTEPAAAGGGAAAYAMAADYLVKGLYDRAIAEATRAMARGGDRAEVPLGGRLYEGRPLECGSPALR